MGQSGTSNNKDTLYNHSDELLLFRKRKPPYWGLFSLHSFSFLLSSLMALNICLIGSGILSILLLLCLILAMNEMNEIKGHIPARSLLPSPSPKDGISFLNSLRSFKSSLDYSKFTSICLASACSPPSPLKGVCRPPHPRVSPHPPLRRVRIIALKTTKILKSSALKNSHSASVQLA